MTLDVFIALTAFAFVSSITPGPNNLMLMASGANFGLRRTVPHMLGVALGFSLMVVLVGIGLAEIFQRLPTAHLVLKIVSVLYLGWLALKIARAAPPREGGAAGRPFTFLQAAGFQWVNPKAWAMALTAVTVYAAGDLYAILAVAAVFGAVNLPSITVWVMLGRQMRRFLTSPRRLAGFNWTMAALLIGSLYPVLWP